jgi:hypothetical protein
MRHASVRASARCGGVDHTDGCASLGTIPPGRRPVGARPRCSRPRWTRRATDAPRRREGSKIGEDPNRDVPRTQGRRLVLALWAMALACLVTLAIASAADSQLHQTDADLLYDAATMDTDANGCMEQLW